jgi:hypothetical protein
LSDEYIADPNPTCNLALLPGSLADLVARARGRPIYCTASLAVRRALMNVVVRSLRLGFPDGEFVDALTLYRDYNDWDRRWSSERERYGAAIVVTRAEDLARGTEPFAGVAGQHMINLRLGREIEDFVRRGLPVAWQAVVFPASYWISRFVLEPVSPASAFRYAELLLPADATEIEIFHPLIGPTWFWVERV